MAVSLSSTSLNELKKIISLVYQVNKTIQKANRVRNYKKNSAGEGKTAPTVLT
jgi:hypothetical protein